MPTSASRRSPRSAAASATGACTFCSKREDYLVNHKRPFRVYREQKVAVRRRDGRKRAIGTPDDGADGAERPTAARIQGNSSAFWTTAGCVHVSGL